MARTIAVIQQSMIDNLVAALATGGYIVDPTTWSMFDYRMLLTYVCAVGWATLEQLWDAFTAVIGVTIAAAPPQTALWLQNFVLNIFQFDATTPQIVQFDATNIAPYYTTVNTAMRIVKQCAVVPGGLGATSVKVAKAGPVALTSPELSVLQSALNAVTIPGVVINAISDNADNIFIGGTVTYSGQYAAIITSTVPAAIQAYLAAIPVTGIVGINSAVGLMKLTDLIAAVRAVPGVIDFELNNVNARRDAVAYVPGSNNLVSGNAWLTNEYNSGLSGAGYMVTETTASYTINDSLTYSAV